MDEQRKTMIRRRDVLLAVTASGVAAVAGVAAIPAVSPAAGTAAAKRDKRRAQYQPNSPEIQTFYRVNRYPAK